MDCVKGRQNGKAWSRVFQADTHQDGENLDATPLFLGACSVTEAAWVCSAQSCVNQADPPFTRISAPWKHRLHTRHAVPPRGHPQRGNSLHQRVSNCGPQTSSTEAAWGLRKRNGCIVCERANLCLGRRTDLIYTAVQYTLTVNTPLHQKDYVQSHQYVKYYKTTYITNSITKWKEQIREHFVLV